MRDTKALRDARDRELDPYARRFTYPKWTRTVTVLDVYQLFRRLPEFSSWDKARHERVAREYLIHALVHQRVQTDVLTRYAAVFGDHGPLISGGFRDHWPDVAKDNARMLARQLDTFMSRSIAHWQASGRQLATWRDLRDRCFANPRLNAITETEI